MNKPSAQIQMIADEIKEEEREILSKFTLPELSVIMSSVIRHLDIEYVVQKGKENKNLPSDISGTQRVIAIDRGNFNKNKKREARNRFSRRNKKLLG